MSKDEIIDGYTFEYNSEHKLYECRGEVCYDEDHDEAPEEGLWTAGCKLERKLKNQGISAVVEYSAQGWVDVCIN